MRFYHIQPSELNAMDHDLKQALLLDMGRIRARESLEFIANVGASFGGDKGKARLMALARQAFSGDQRAHAVMVHAICT